MSKSLPQRKTLTEARLAAIDAAELDWPGRIVVSAEEWAQFVDAAKRIEQEIRAAKESALRVQQQGRYGGRLNELLDITTKLGEADPS